MKRGMRLQSITILLVVMFIQSPLSSAFINTVSIPHKISQNKETADTLLAKSDGDLNKALEGAIRGGTVEPVKELMRWGADLTKANGKGRLPLHYAIKKGDLAIINKLLRAGAD